MAIYHLSVKAVSRSVGRSATAAAAYRSAGKITDLTTGQVFDYTRKRGIDRVVEEIKAWVGDKKIVQLSIVYTGGEQSEDLAALKTRIEALGPVEPAAPILATPIIAAHVGPMGLSVIAVTG